MYIRYHEAEKLFILYPTLISILESLQTGLELTSEREFLDEDIYQLCVKKNDSGFIPTGGTVSDKTGNIAVNYIKCNKSTQKEIKNDILHLSQITQKINISRKRLTSLQSLILEIYYWGEPKTWSQVTDELKKSGISISVRCAQEKRKKGIAKIASISKVNIDDYKWALCLANGEGEG